jgi:hypothetical protein
MASTNREYEGVFVQGNSMEPRQLRGLSHGSVVRPTASPVPRDLVKAGHAFYVVAVNSLFVRGTPSRLNYSQSSGGLP